MLKKEIEEAARRSKDHPCTWIRRINILKITITESNIQIQCNPHKNSNGILHQI
jgi:hypothetical protein